MLESVEWGCYKLNDLFEKIKVKSLKYKTSELPSSFKYGYELPALTAGISNQGLNNFVPLSGATILKDVIPISANGTNTGATFYQSTDFTVLQDAYAIRWVNTDDQISKNIYLYLVGSISKAISGNYEWTNKAGWERVKNNKIQLPIKNGKIDFEFMEYFISELEADRVSKLEAYLSVTGLKDYVLTQEEHKVLDDFTSENFAEFNLVDEFHVKNSGNILSRDIVKNGGDTPYLCASAENNSVNSYISYNEDYLDKGNCVFIGGKTFVVTYQEKDFYSNDSHNLILHVKDEEKRTRLNQLYLATCIHKSLKHKYSWGDSISNRKIQKDKVSLPTKNKQPDYSKVETFISAIQKLVIKDVVLYTDRKIAAHKEIILAKQRHTASRKSKEVCDSSEV